VRRFLSRLRNLVRPGHAERDLAREIDAHLTLIEDAARARGMSPEEARRAARLSIGGIEQTKELHRQARSFAPLEDARRDVVYGLRLLKRSPIFTLTAALSFAIGVGANTAIFAVANSLIARPPDGVQDAAALVDIGAARGDGGLNPMPYASVVELSARASSFTGIFAQGLFPSVMGLRVDDDTERISGLRVTPNFFQVLGARAAAGRVLEPGDANAGNVVVLDHAFWRRRFNGDAGVVGRGVRINGMPMTVAGVVDPSFSGTGLQRPDVWLPMGAARSTVVAGGRLRPGVTIETAAAEVTAIGQAIDRDRGAAHAPMPLAVLPISRAGGNRNVIAGFAVALVAIVSLVLIVACANVAGLGLARAMVRTPEMALRVALGAGRARLIRQLLTESAVVSAVGGLVGMAFARAIIAIAPALLPPSAAPFAVTMTIDGRVWMFTLALALFTALVSGIAPAMAASKADPLAGLKRDTRTSAGASRSRRAFVVAQIAFSVLLVALAGQFVRALRVAGMVNRGFDSRGLETASMNLSTGGIEEPARLGVWTAVLDRVRAMPGAEAASLARVAPGGWEGIGVGDVTTTDATAAASSFSPSWNIVEPGYFTTLRIPLVAGRDFTPADAVGSPPVVVIGETIARRLWPGQDAVGKSVVIPAINPGHQSPTRTVRIIGVVRDIKSTSLIDGRAESYVYLPLRQNQDPGYTAEMTIVSRSRDGRSLVPALADAIRQVDPNLVIARSGTMEESVALGLAPQRLVAAVAGTLGIVGLMLAAIGLYGIVGFGVAQRRQEFGIRLALGARPSAIVRMVLRQGMVLVAVGCVTGLTLAALVGQGLLVFLFGLPGVSVPMFIGIALLFGVVGLVACAVPARRAMTSQAMERA